MTAGASWATLRASGAATAPGTTRTTSAPARYARYVAWPTCSCSRPRMAMPQRGRGVGDTVADRVEERAARPGPPALTRDRPVEDVGETGEDQADHAEEEVAVGDRERSADGEGETDDREAVSRDADTVQASTDRFE